MGVDIHIHLVKFNHETRYFEEIKLFRLDKKINKYCEVDLFPGRNSEMFDAMSERGDSSYGVFPYCLLRINSLAPELQKIIKEKKETIGYYGFYEINLASFDSYVKENPKVKDFDADWEEDSKNIPRKDNPLKSLYEDCITYLCFAEGWGWLDDDLSEYKMIYYFDC